VHSELAYLHCDRVDRDIHFFIATGNAGREVDIHLFAKTAGKGLGLNGFCRIDISFQMLALLCFRPVAEVIPEAVQVVDIIRI